MHLWYCIVSRRGLQVFHSHVHLLLLLLFSPPPPPPLLPLSSHGPGVLLLRAEEWVGLGGGDHHRPELLHQLLHGHRVEVLREQVDDPVVAHLGQAHQPTSKSPEKFEV